jgi:hypothetical protein
MNQVDIRQARAINILIAVITGLTGLVGFLAYRENLKHSKLNDEVLKLDKEIKILELARAKNQMLSNSLKNN